MAADGSRPGDAPGAPRVRFAPSPTGYFHVGSARTALFNWLFARHAGGTFILRIEDTDTERGREEWVIGILAALDWLGLDVDEGPYRQSLRSELYRAAAGRLLEAGMLYACDCTRSDIEERRSEKATPGYDGYCRDRGLSPGPGRVLRFRVPHEGEVVIEDLVRGEVRFAASSIEDFVVVKSNGAPLFVLANVVDDIDMGISHVIRGEDLLPSTPKAVLLWEALSAEPLPAYAHLPMLVNEQRKKLSKRKDPVALEQYRSEGYLPEAFLNYLALLGWSPRGDREIVPLQELVAEFDLGEVNHAPAFFDVKKLAYVNGVYLRSMDSEDFVERCRPWLDAGPWEREAYDAALFEKLAPLVQERVSTLSEVTGLVGFAFVDDLAVDALSWEKAVVRDPGAFEILAMALDRFSGERWGSAAWEAPEIRAVIEDVAAQTGRKLAKAQAPVRVAVLGSVVGLPLFESMEVVGRARVVKRLKDALDRLSSGANSDPAGSESSRARH